MSDKIYSEGVEKRIGGGFGPADAAQWAPGLGLLKEGAGAALGGGLPMAMSRKPTTVLEDLKLQRINRAASYEHHSALAKQAEQAIADLDLAISALTPPLQHKGGGEADEGRPTTSDIVASAGMPTDDQIAANVVDDHAKRIMCDSRCERLGWDAHRNGWSLDDCPGGDHTEAREWRNGWACREQHIRSAVAISEGVGDARIEPPISTLQASSGEGETTKEAIAYFGTDAGLIQLNSDGSTENLTSTEPAAYSPVNNADEPVTKPEADFFAQAILPVQSGIEFSVDGGPKQATGAAKLFGGLGIFGKPKALVGEGA